jgi:hypothetical protein
VKRPTSIGLSSIVIILAVNVALSEPPPKVETIRGQVVAYADGLVCLNESADWSMLIHVQDHTNAELGKFIQVRFSLPCKKTPQWLNRKSHEEEFHLRRELDDDSVLDEFLECSSETSEKCPQIPKWRVVPGAENKMPYGRIVPSYLSADLPLVPVV